jgi:PKD repeat protein
MMKSRTLLFVCLTLLYSGLLSQVTWQPGAHLPVATPAGIGKIDTRVDNMGYWRRMADSGFVRVAPVRGVQPAQYTGSRIEGRLVMSANSGDVPLYNVSTTESENSVFVKPSSNTTLLNSNNSTPNPVVGLYGANYFTSSDGGQTWGGSIGGPTGQGNSGDPTTAIDLNGRYFVGFINNSSGQSVAYSTDGGVNWTLILVSNRPGNSSTLLDKNHLWIDNGTSSTYAGQLYDAWTPFGGTNDSQIEIMRSTNSGVSWVNKFAVSAGVSAGAFNHGVNIQTGPAGQVYVAWAIYDSWPADETAIGFNKSTNGGASYGTAYRIINNIRGIRYSETAKDMRVNSFPSMAADISGGAYNGNIYVVWANIGVPGTNTGSDIDVYLIRSSDNGATWSSPIRVNQDPSGQGKEHFFPWINCDPTTGYLAVTYYDDRNVTQAECETYVSLSTDAGNTWEDIKVSDVAFSPSPIPGLAGGYMGDYIGISARGGKVYPVWTDNRTGSAMTYTSPFVMNLVPGADFTVGNQKPCPGDTVLFTDLSWKFPTTWQWTITPATFSYVNGTSQASQNPAVLFNAYGNYTVKLKVTNTHGSDSLTRTDYISMNFVNSDFTADKFYSVTSTPITFTDASDCNVLSWSWDFGPGATPATAITQGPQSVQYSSTGDKTITLTVNGGVGTTKTNYIHIVPNVFNMANGEVYTCSGTFYDSQGTSNYLNNEDYTFTFYPQTPGNAVRAVFSSFALESSTNCINDYLIIYNGTNIRDSQIGDYCGTTSPGTVTASNPAGALTFRFHSNSATTAQGWQATLSCVAITPAYCAASGGSCAEYISNVSIGTISNSSGCSGGFANYTSLTARVYKGVASTLAVTNGVSIYPTDNCYVWVDWNQDMDFNDSGESINAIGGPVNFTAQIVAPADAIYGNHRMRIRIYDTNYDDPSPCGTATYGEVEDYTLIIGQPGLWVGGAAGQTQNWNTAANWDNNTVPAVTTNVLIPGGLTYYPVLTSTGNCHDLQISDGATVTVNPGGNLTIGHNLADGQGAGGTLIVYGNCQVNGALLQRLGSGVQVKNGGTLTQY